MSTTAIEAIKLDTGEIQPALGVDEGREFHGYSGVATVSLNEEQAKKLAEKLPDEAHDILPTGEVYVSQVHYRRLLNEVFGPGGWALVPRGGFVMQGNTICREYALVGPGGRFISEAIGEADYQPNNKRMSYASACEAAKSNALTRCSKDLGIASECWDRRFCEEFKAKFCLQVFMGRGEPPRWRRRDTQPFYGETGPVPPRQGQPDRHDETSAQLDPTKPAFPAGDSPAWEDGNALAAECLRLSSGDKEKAAELLAKVAEGVRTARGLKGPGVRAAWSRLADVFAG